MDITIIEGCRGTGKTTVANQLRQTIPELTLVNPTGFHKDGTSGFQKVYQYYSSWIDYLRSMVSHDSKIIFDRFFFSEKVYSDLYKSYDFSFVYNYFLGELSTLASQTSNVNLILLKTENKEVLTKRLNREKVPFAEVKDSVENSLEQQNSYIQLFENAKYQETSFFKVNEVNTDSKDATEVFNIVKNIINSN